MSLLLSLALAAASPVYGTRSDALAVEALHNFGGCIVKMTPSGAEAVLALDYRTDEYREKLRRLARGHDRCTLPRTELRFNGVLFAGAMAEALLEEPKRSVLRRLIDAEEQASSISARSPLEEMTLCSVKTRPAAVGRLLKSDVQSEEEAQAIEALTPTLDACLAAAHKVELNRPALRSVLALAAWRVVSEAESPPHAEGAQ